MPPKRKSKDAPSSNNPPPSRARVDGALKRSSAPDGNDQNSDAFVPKPAKRARKAPARTARLDANIDDELADIGRAGSKPTTIEEHLMDQNKKSKDFIQHFKEQVAQGQDRVLETLSKLRQDLMTHHSSLPPQEANDDGLSEMYATLHAAAHTLSTDDNPLFEHTQLLLRLSRSILKCYAKTEAETRGNYGTGALASLSPRKVWEQDEEGMSKLLACGKEVALKAVEGWINPSSTEASSSDGPLAEGDGEVDGAEEVDGLARGLFGKSNAKAKAESWGLGAKRQMLALAAVVRTLEHGKGGVDENQGQ